MDKTALPTRLQVAHQQVVRHPVSEIRGKDLALLWSFHHKGHGTAGPVSTGCQFLMQGQDILLQVLFKAQGIDRAPLMLAALPVGTVDVFQGEQGVIPKLPLVTLSIRMGR